MFSPVCSYGQAAELKEIHLHKTGGMKNEHSAVTRSDTRKARGIGGKEPRRYHYPRHGEGKAHGGESDRGG
jgi:hypothetical protein